MYGMRIQMIFCPPFCKDVWLQAQCIVALTVVKNVALTVEKNVALSFAVRSVRKRCFTVLQPSHALREPTGR